MFRRTSVLVYLLRKALFFSFWWCWDTQKFLACKKLWDYYGFGDVFNKSGSVMHMLECGIKAHLIRKCLKNGIERSLVVSGKKCNYHLRGRGMGKNGAFRIKLLWLLVVKGNMVFWWCSGSSFTGWLLFVLSLQQFTKTVTWLQWKGERILKVGLMLKWMWIVSVRKFIPNSR